MLQTLRFAVRRLIATPGFSVVAIGTLALAIAANTIIYSLVDAVLLRPLPFKDPDRLLQIWTAHSEAFESPYVGARAFEEWRELPDVFAAIEPYRFRAATLIGAGEPDIVPTSEVGGGLMETLGIPPLVGRALQPADERQNATAVAVIGEALWRSRFGGDVAIIGRRIRLDDEMFEVVGVMPARFRFPRASHQLWIPPRPDPASRPRPRPVQAIARLRAGVSVDAAEQQLLAAARAAEPAATGVEGRRYRLHPFGANRVDPPARRALYVLLGAVAFVLLIAGANVAGLMLVRGAVRHGEVAVRAALGASRADLVWPLLTEALLITLIAAIAGALLAVGLIDPLARLSPSDVTRLSYNTIAPNWRVFAFTGTVAAIAAILAGVLPALRTSRPDLGDALRSGPARGSAPRQQRFRHAVIIAELAISVALLIAAGLLTRTFVSVMRVSPGFDTEHVLAVDLTIPRRSSRTDDAQRRLFDTMLERIRALPGVARAEDSGGIPPGGSSIVGPRFETDDGRVQEDDKTFLEMTDVGPDYFAALGLPLKDGRSFTPQEIGWESDAIILSEGLARRLWPSERAVGHRLRLERGGTLHTVVGVAGDVFQIDYSTSPQSRLAVYHPRERLRLSMMRTFVIRAEGDPASLRRAVQAQIRAVDPDQPIAQIATASELYESFLSPPKFYASIMSVFAALAALLAIVGLYGLLAYATAQRTREFGIRVALGAGPRSISRMVLRHGLVLAAAGAVAGVAVSLAAARLIESLLVGVRPTDIATYAAIVFGVFALTAIASWLPARRASRTDPAVVLRAE